MKNVMRSRNAADTRRRRTMMRRKGRYEIMEKLFTVDNIAEMTGLTSRTIRNYIADGRLKGRKIGSQWRFTEADVESLFSAGTATRSAAPAGDAPTESGTVGEFLAAKHDEGIAVCAVVDYPTGDQDAPKAVMQMLETAAEDYDDDELQIAYEWMAEKGVGRFTFTGDIDPVSKMIKVIRKKG